MSRLRRIAMVRHGETEGKSSVRFHGSTDVALSREGGAQMRRAASSLGHERFDLVVASPLRRAWESAWIVGRGAPVRLESDFREIHFGRWEGMTREEIQAADPVLFEDWQARKPDFEYPNGERRAEFEKRVTRGLERMRETDAASALLVVHKGVIRALARKLLGEELENGKPDLGGSVRLTRAADESWFIGSRSSNPPGLDEIA